LNLLTDQNTFLLAEHAPNEKNANELCLFRIKFDETVGQVHIARPIAKSASMHAQPIAKSASMHDPSQKVYNTKQSQLASVSL
jgi:hypothetical protein